MKKIISLAAIMGVLSAGPAMALTINSNNGGTINLSPDGLNVNTNINGVQDSVDLRSGSLDIKTNLGGKQINTSVGSSATGLNINSTNGKTVTNVNILRDASGNTFSVDVNKGLSTQGDIDVSAKRVIVNLDGNSVSLIKSDDDLNVYKTLVVKERPSVKTVELGNGSVRVIYRQPAKFLGLIGTDMGATVVVNEQGNVSVQLPWYSFLFTKKNLDSIKSNIRTRLASSNGQVTVSSDGSADSVRVQNGAKVINIVTAEIETGVSVQ